MYQIRLFILFVLAIPYNGNISSAVWNSYIGYNYTYDNLNRLTYAHNFRLDGSGDLDGFNYYNVQYDYDKQGNMTRLTLIEEMSIEDLEAEYSGNQRLRINDLTAENYGWTEYYPLFDDYSNDPDAQYTYNTNGSMTHDPYKGAYYRYNALGMPLRDSIPAILGRIDYTYSATGVERLLPLAFGIDA
jgi:hypothetical protein